MTERGQLAYETESVRLYPAKTFYQALLHQPEDVRQSLQMKRLGLLLRQLHPHEEQLLLDVSGTSVTNADFKIRAKLHSQQPVPDEVRKKLNYWRPPHSGRKMEYSSSGAISNKRPLTRSIGF